MEQFTILKKATYGVLLLCVMAVGVKRAEAQTIYTFAGNEIPGYLGDGVQATSTELYGPSAVAIDGSGNIYIADYVNQRIRKVNTSGIISTIAGNGTGGFTGDGSAATLAELNDPSGVAVDGAGNVYIADFSNNRVRKVNTSGVISTFAGNGSPGYSGDGSAATLATLNSPNGVAVDGAGNVYIADYLNNCVRKVNTAGIITTIAGDGTGSYSGDGGPATLAELSRPTGVAVDGLGNVYIADCSNACVRKVNTAGIITTIAGDAAPGYFGDGGAATLAELDFPTSVTIDGAGNLYIADDFNSRVRKVNTSGIISTIAGNGTAGYTGDGIAATAAELHNPVGVVVSSGKVYIADANNNSIRLVAPPITTVSFDGGSPQSLTVCQNSGINFINSLLTVTDAGVGLTETYSVTASPAHGVITAGNTVTSGTSVSPTGWAYSPTVGYTGTDAFTIQVSNGTNTATTVINVTVNATPAPITGPAYVCPGNTITLSDATTGGTWSSNDLTIATVGSTGVVTGTSVGSALISYSNGCASYFIITVGNPIITTIAGTGVGGYITDGVAATSTEINQPVHMVMDASGNLYFTDYGNSRIRKIDPTGIITTVAGNGTAGYIADNVPATSTEINNPAGLAIDAAGNLYFADYHNFRVRKVSTSGIITTIAGTGTSGSGASGIAATASAMSNPYGIAIDAFGNIYYSDRYNYIVRKIDGSGVVHTVAGISGSGAYSGDNGPASAAQLNQPLDLAFDLSGNLYLTDQANNRVRMINTSGTITTVAGSGSAGYGGDGSAATSATVKLNNPVGLWVDSAYNLYIGDYGNNRVRMVNTSGIISTIAGSSSFGGYGGDGGPPTAARLNQPQGVAVFGTGNIYISDQTNNRIRKIAPVAPATMAAISGSSSLCQGVPVLFTETTTGGTWSSSNTAVATVGSSTGAVTPVSGGTATISYTLTSACGTEYATLPVTVNAFSAGTISGPAIVCPGNTITLTDATSGGTWSSSNTSAATVAGGIVTGVAAGNTTISYTITNSCGTLAATQQVVVGNPIITTFAGSGSSGFSGDGGAATLAKLNVPHGLCVDAANNVYIADNANGAIRKVTPAGIITTVAGTGTLGYSGDNGPATAAQFNTIFEVIVDGSGNLYISDNGNSRVRMVNASSGIVTTIAGTGTPGYNGDNIAATTARLNSPCGLAMDATGNLYIGDGSNNRVRKVNTSGVITTVAGIGFGGYFGDGGAATSAWLRNPNYLHMDPNGNLIVVDNGNHRIRKVDQFGLITTVAGNGTAGGTGDGGPATAAELDFPGGVAFDGANNMYIATDITETVRMVNAVTGTISTVAGTAGTAGYTGDGGSPATATMHTVVDVAFDLNGNMLIADQVNNVIRKIAPVQPLQPITGVNTLCQGATTTLSESVSGGSWISGSTGIATVGSTTGVVTGVAGGTVTISYTDNVACGLAYVTQQMTINPLPAPSPITGLNIVCIGSTIGLSDPTPSGVWSSGTPGVASVGSISGVVTGVSAGTASISYTVSNSCGSTSVTYPVTVNAASSTISGTSNICVGATTILTGSIPGGTWTSADPTVATVGSGSGLVNGLAAGTVTITYTYSGGCTTLFPMTINPLPSAISGTLSVCIGSTTALTDGGVGTWTSVSTGVATVGSSSGVVTGVTAGTSVISYTLGTGCSISATVTVNALPAAITPPGAVSMCVGATATLSDASPGGTWSSDATSIATVGTSGIVTGVTAGTANISYTNAIGCSSVKQVTVLVTPSALSPSSTTVCTGLTVTLTDAVSGGTWASSAPGTASVAAGVVTGVTVGTAVITYSIGTCYTTATVTVNPSPNAGTVSGATTVCAGSATTYTDAAGGGVWSSSNSSIASVGSSSGIVTGVTAGTATISYSVTNGCGTAAATQNISVLTSPAAGTIIGAAMICAGTYSMMIDTISGGIWSMTNSHATVSLGGLVTGVSIGVDTVVYTVTNACGTISTIHPVTIGTFLSAGTITGASGVCTGSTITLTDFTPGGVWSSSNSSATVAGGVVTGIAGGVDTIAYTVTSGCGSTAATHIITVTPVPNAGTITGPVILCVGMVTNYTDAAPGGVWNVSNPTGSITSWGLYTPISLGTDTISYAVTNTCGTAIATKAVTMGPMLTVGAISGGGNVCAGSTITLTDGTPGGVWSATNGDATVVGGVVTGVTAGTDTILYTVTNSCGSLSASAPVNIIPIPFAGTISGPSTVCVGSNITLTDPAPSGFWSASNSNATVSGGVVTGVFVGTDIISYSVSNMCGSDLATMTVSINTTPTAGTITGPASVCVGSSITLSDATPGGVWSASNADAAVSGGAVTGMIAGADTIIYTVTTSCGTAAATAAVLVNPLPFAGTVFGPASVCTGSTITLTDTTTGGSWSASNANATVSGGIVTGIIPGVDTIAYNVSNGCGTASAMQAVTINPPATAGTIMGATDVCVGAAITLSDTVTGGTWSASNAAATVSGGIVSGVALGIDTIAYTVTTACGTAMTTAVVNVNTVPSAGSISGPTNVCKSATITLTDYIPGGTWSSSNAHATVSGGIVTGVSAGLDTIMYTVSNSCGSSVASKPIGVTQTPNVSTISGATNVCNGSTIALADATTGGTWSSSNNAIATVTGTGVVSGVATGSVTISYTLTNACGAHSAVHAVSVLPASDCNGATLVNNVTNTQPELKVYPNPNKGIYTMNLLSGNEEQVRVVITNVIGNKVKEFTTVTNKPTEIEMNNAAGIYLLSVYSSDGKYVAKVTIE